ncbi:MAG: DNA-3-methyladenine glycosylase family protein [Candidatus Bathyarchaeia archaeon]
MKLKLNGSTPFDLMTTLQCGQLFRWQKRGDWWYGIVDKQVLKVRQIDYGLEFEGVDTRFIKDYFRFDDNLPQIMSEVGRDRIIKQAAKTFPGLRIVRQNPWEALISYICATYKNIPAIKGMVFELAKCFGEKVSLESSGFYSFPAPEVLARAALYKLRKCKVGFRAKSIRDTARMVVSKQVDFEALKETDYETARSMLLQLPGVGNKVADCISLFSLEKLEAFPIDVWMKRIIHKHYASHFDVSLLRELSQKKPLRSKVYNSVGCFAREYFGKYAGYAQQYLFHFIRS